MRKNFDDKLFLLVVMHCTAQHFSDVFTYVANVYRRYMWFCYMPMVSPLVEVDTRYIGQGVCKCTVYTTYFLLGAALNVYPVLSFNFFFTLFRSSIDISPK